jgi:mannose-6-phosphate isomerase
MPRPAASLPVRPRPYRLLNEIQPYEWGTRDEEAFIPRLLGIPPEPGRPYAELWIGAHPKAPSKVSVHGEQIGLDAWIAAHPGEILGERALRRFGPRLPFLLKVLSAGEALSIQAHPNKAQAEKLHARDPAHYPDDNHKPEIAVALDDLAALVGIKPLAGLQEALARYPELGGILGPEAVGGDFQKETAAPQERARALWSALLRRSVTQPQALDEALDRLADRLRAARPPLSEAEALFLELREKYPGPDVGLCAVFLLNLVHLQEGQAIFTNAGVPHAYLKGNIVECMASSDNVVRVGLTTKFKDAEALLEILDSQPRPAQILEAAPGPGETIYPVPSDEFQVSRLRLEAGSEAGLASNGGVSILLVTRGRALVAWEAGLEYGEEAFSPGQAALLPAVLVEARLRAVEGAEVFRVEVPDLTPRPLP